MEHRIVTHGNCTDGYSSAFVVKRYFNSFLGTKLSAEEIQDMPVFGVQPQDIQQGKFSVSPGDIVVDLPLPREKIFFWCDHHLTSKPQKELPENHYWKVAPSCAGYLIDIALEKGVKLSRELLEFKKAIDINDSAAYTKKDIKEIFYKQKIYGKPLQKLAAIGAMFNTRDRVLNDEIFRTLLTRKLGETPLSSKSLWQLNPMMFYKAQLEGFGQWRKNVDTYLVYDPKAKCVVQDDRKAKFSRGIADRFYVYMKYPQASYSLNLRLIEDEEVRIGIGSNIFHKERCKIDIGALCQEVGAKFGGTGGGHYYVGGATIKTDKCDETIRFVLDRFGDKTK